MKKVYKSYDIPTTPEEYVKCRLSNKARIYKGPRTKEVIECDLKTAEPGSRYWKTLQNSLTKLQSKSN